MNPNQGNWNTTNTRYKTMMCKHYNTSQGCTYGEKCQFAHGPQELRINQGGNDMPMNNHSHNSNQNQRNPLNYKIIKCKNFENEGSCKYGTHCSFAHGDSELRNKGDNMQQMNPMNSMNPMNGMNPMMYSPFMYDYNMMNQMNQMGMPPMEQGIPLGDMNMNPMQMGMNAPFDPMMFMNPQMQPHPDQMNTMKGQMPGNDNTQK